MALISVVVCSLNGEERIGACLDALSAQDDRGFEVIVVDDGSADGTAAIAGRRGVRVVRHPATRGLAAARNSGVAAARGEIVAFTDDDCLPARGWLAGLRRSWAEAGPDVAGIGGPALPAGPDSALIRYLELNNPLGPPELDLARSTSAPYRFARYLARNAARTAPTGARPIYALVGANMSFRRRTILAAGGFDDRFTFGAEEEELCERIRGGAAGGATRLLYTPDARVAHLFRPGLRDTLRRSRAYGRGSARLHLKHGRYPTLFPFPVLVAGLALASARRPRCLPFVALLPLALFSRGPRTALRSRDWVHLAAPFIQLAQEAASDVGFVRGYVQMRRDFAQP
jgi:glycosyltransferase involved in cell wall biosynthesis